jgi:hypothetical protein
MSALPGLSAGEVRTRCLGSILDMEAIESPHGFRTDAALHDVPMSQGSNKFGSSILHQCEEGAD